MTASDCVADRIRQITERVAPANTDVDTSFEGLALFVAAGVFDPSRGRSARKMWQAIADFPPARGDRVLEIGTGSGLLSIRAYQFAQSPVTAVDIMPEAVRSARINLERHNVPATLAVSDMFAAVDGRVFDYIIFNAPTAHPSVSADNRGVLTLWDLTGQLKKRFVDGVATALSRDNPAAKAVMMYSSYTDYDGTRCLDFAGNGLRAHRHLVDKDDLSEAGVMIINRVSSPALA